MHLQVWLAVRDLIHREQLREGRHLVLTLLSRLICLLPRAMQVLILPSQVLQPHSACQGALTPLTDTPTHSNHILTAVHMETSYLPSDL